MGDDCPVRPVISRFGQLARQARQRNPVDGQSPRGVNARFDPAPISPPADGVAADPEEIGGFLDPEHRHYVTLTQIRLRSISPAAYA